MNQEAIGKFISTCRRDKGLTQIQLVEKLNASGINRFGREDIMWRLLAILQRMPSKSILKNSWMNHVEKMTMEPLFSGCRDTVFDSVPF